MESIEFYRKEWLKRRGTEAPAVLSAHEMSIMLSLDAGFAGSFDIGAHVETIPTEEQMNLESIEFYQKEWLKRYGTEAPAGLSAYEMSSMLSLNAGFAGRFGIGAHVETISTEEQMKSIRMVFDTFDMDRDGELSFCEVMRVVEAGLVDMRNAESREILRVLDHGSKLGFDGFYKLMTNISS